MLALLSLLHKRALCIAWQGELSQTIPVSFEELTRRSSLRRLLSQDRHTGKMLHSCEGLRTNNKDGGGGESSLEEAGQGDTNGRK